ncbi:M23 family metallopeptidase [Parvibaculum sp.]|uniref:M23 family metallopeptidase n=1 Tax=Parvibaculum sp. TaxID=2024848 RepID=UPI00391C3CE5
MKRRHRNAFGLAQIPVAAILLAALFLLPAVSANASDASHDLAAVSYILPLTKPEPAIAAYPERGLHFGDPIDVSKARMTSGFGWRTHPVLKDKRFHKGVDYAAPKGTPVYATEDGIVGRAGWRGNYGKLVTIKHSDHVETFYAHLSAFAPGIRPGASVKKGDVIGYVGMTGLATGNHLYYEVVVNNEHIDPLASDLNEQVNVLSASIERPKGRIAESRSGSEAR